MPIRKSRKSRKSHNKFKDITIKYYDKDDAFYSVDKYNTIWHYLPKAVNIFNMDETYDEVKICKPLEELFIYDQIKKRSDFNRKDDIFMIVAKHNKKVIAIADFIEYPDYLYLDTFCVEQHFRKTEFSEYFLKKILLMLKFKNKPVKLFSSDYGMKLYRRVGFIDDNSSLLKYFGRSLVYNYYVHP